MLSMIQYLKSYISFLTVFLILIILCLFISCYSTNRYRAKEKSIDRKTEKNIRYGSSYSSFDSFISEWLGTPYKYGGLSRRGVDCSGFAHLLMLHVYKKEIPRISKDQYRKGRKINRSRLLRGDLVFFKISKGREIDHVGIYLGKDKFVHASQKKGVIVSKLSEKYYKKRYAVACRY